MTEEAAGFDKKPDVPDESGEATASEDAAQPDGTPADEAGAREGPAVDVPETEQEQEAQEDATAALLAQLEQARTAVNERTQDVQRIQAEFQNYRRRVERDREAVKEVAVAKVMTELLPVLDDIGRARDHGELVGGFKSVAESLETAAAKLGLMQFGKEGEPFDPNVHEALMHSYSPEVTETTCVQILQPGYRIGERTIRPARVGVAEPPPGAAEESADEEDSGGPEKG